MSPTIASKLSPIDALTNPLLLNASLVDGLARCYVRAIAVTSESDRDMEFVAFLSPEADVGFSLVGNLKHVSTLTYPPCFPRPEAPLKSTLQFALYRVDAQDVELDDALDDEFYEEQELRGGPGDDDDDNNDDDEDVYRSDRPAEEDTPRSPAPSANGGAPSANGSTPAGNGTPASQGRATRSGSKRRREDYVSACLF